MRRNKTEKTLHIAAGILLRLLVVMAVIALVLSTVITCKEKPESPRTDIAAAYDIHGIDISHHQGTINWGRVKRATLHRQPISFVFIKCTEGITRTDRLYKRNQKEIRKQGFLFGAYHFFLPNRSAKKQAENFIRNANLRPGDLPPVLDVEKCGNLNKRQLAEAVLTWLDIVGKHYNCVPILYTGHSFRKKHLTDDRLGKYPLWKAHYQKGGVITGNEWTFCQYTRHGHVAGIGKDTGYVDLNVFCGTKEDLRSLLLE